MRNQCLCGVLVAASVEAAWSDSLVRQSFREHSSFYMTLFARSQTTKLQKFRNVKEMTNVLSAHVPPVPIDPSAPSSAIRYFPSFFFLCENENSHGPSAGALVTTRSLVQIAVQSHTHALIGLVRMYARGMVSRSPSRPIHMPLVPMQVWWMDGQECLLTPLTRP